ncbi:MAG: DMT family transporter [Alphaproteobacteria bacterium]|jgi:drug/metabolite transporter (DMT)-like permease
MRAAFETLSPSLRAMMMMLVALLLFTLMGVFIKLSAKSLPVMEVVFFRNFLAVILLLPLVWHAGAASIRMNRPKLFVGRAVINAIGMVCGFTSLTMIPLAENTALTFTSPIFVTIGAVIFLGEVIRLRRVMAILVGLVGALVILRPGFTEVSVGALLALASALTIALASLLVKKMTETETSIAIVFWMVMFQTPLTLIPAAMVWQWPDPISWAFLWGMALSGTVAHILFTKACGLVEITSLQPLEFAKLPFSVVLAWLIFGEWPEIWVWIGGAVIFAATAYITRREAAARRSLKPNHGQKESRL